MVFGVWYIWRAECIARTCDNAVGAGGLVAVYGHGRQNPGEGMDMVCRTRRIVWTWSAEPGGLYGHGLQNPGESMVMVCSSRGRAWSWSVEPGENLDMVSTTCREYGRGQQNPPPGFGGGIVDPHVTHAPVAIPPSVHLFCPIENPSRP